MDELEDFLKYLRCEFDVLEISLCEVLKKEKKLKEESYLLNYRKVDLFRLDTLLIALTQIVGLEVQLQERLALHTVALDKIEYEYYRMTQKALHSDLLQVEFKETLYYSRLMITRVQQLKEMLREGLELHPKKLSKDTEIFFASVEHLASKILEFIRYLSLLTTKIISFEKEAYYPEPKTYGRAMSSREFRETITLKCLHSEKDPTPVFDAPVSVIRKVQSFSRDEIRTFFAQIGVEGAKHVVFFRTRLKPINSGRPIPQSNGLREYKFPVGIDVELLEAA